MRVAVTVTFWHSATGWRSNTVIVKLWVLASTPPFAVPALSLSLTVTVGNATARRRRILSVPFAAIAGAVGETAGRCHCSL